MPAKSATKSATPKQSAVPPKPLIGITTDYQTPKTAAAFSRLSIGYSDLILASGGLPILLPPMRKETYPEMDHYLKMVSGIVFSGGNDLDPRRYGQQPLNTLQPLAPRREESERLLFDKVMERKLPVLGIGMGMQLINIVHGGTLFQHLPTENPKAMPHTDPSGAAHRHMVIIEDGTFLEEIYGCGEQRVNSMHHQAVNQIGRRLRVGARSHDGVIEAIETTDPNWFCVGLQWHPEDETASALDRQIFECFVQAATRFVDTPMLKLAAA
jgi:putative glutamine amidotransferase